MIATERAWLAGYLEGEGSFIFCVAANDVSRQFIISAVTTDEDIAQRLAVLLHVNANGPYMAKSSTRPFWRVGLARRADVLRLCRDLRPLMGQRRQEQIDKLIQADIDHPERPRGPKSGGQ